jgi:SPP1 family predicted phage head-tail adaptor
MSYDYELTLINETNTEDDIGNQKPTNTETKIFCGIKSIGRNEFYNAAVAGLKPEIIFIIHGYEYNSQEKVKYDGKLYKVMKTYSTNFEEIELTCSLYRGE